MTFILDTKLATSSHKITDWVLSEVRLKDNQHFPWMILIPRISTNIVEIFELQENQQEILMSEIVRLSQYMRNYFKADKINIGTLGNIVSQLHIHVIARFQHDLMWPHSLWHISTPEKKYEHIALNTLISNLREIL